MQVVALTSDNCATDELDDILAGKNFLKRNFNNLPVFLWGFSQGAYLANIMATQHPQSSEWHGYLSVSGVWTHDFGPNFVEKASQHYNDTRTPLQFIKDIKQPFLLFHGERDISAYFKTQAQPFLDNMKIKHTIEISKDKIYKNSKGKITAYISADAGHTIQNLQTYKEWVKTALSFLEENLNN